MFHAVTAFGLFFVLLYPEESCRSEIQSNSLRYRTVPDGNKETY
jgi:hypothetical protein